MVILGGRLRGLAASGGGLYESALYMEDYVSFVAAAPRIEASRPELAAQREPEVLEADSVSFTYPSRDEPSLRDASLVLRRGEVVALVGENGSGKTTFAKLLAGLYRPEHGAIKWDGSDTQAFDPATVHDRVTVIFQDFVRYQLSAHDNIAMGDHERFDDLPAVERAARAAGVHEPIAELGRGYDTLLGPEYFGGSDFSGGQWQRVALARAFFRDAPIVILDEPTASLDARAEASLYSSMGELFADRGVLLISHRFGSVRTADRIYVLRDGRIIEQGRHQELMDLDGYYAELFRLQASRYVD
jgi:ATP-binding cassette subfamily B protein